MTIRPLIDADIPAVSSLLCALAEQFITHESTPEAALAFRREFDPDGIGRLVAAGMVYHVAELKGELAGFIAVRDRQHVFNMFVARAHHRKGVARALWEVARRAAMEGGHPGRFTVNSSNHALPVYEALGFVRTDQMQCKNGIYFNPMQWTQR